MREKTQFDEGWKCAISTYFESFMALCFPDIHTEIDWERGYQFLEEEFQSIQSHHHVGTRVVDQLVEVWKKTGEAHWVLVHLEVQAQPVKNFSERMFIYWYRIFDRYRQSIVSLGVLVDGQPHWRPQRFTQSLWGSDIHFSYPIVKCLDFEEHRGALEQSPNPFALVILAQLATLKAKDGESKLVSKTALTRKFYERGWSREEVLKMYYCLDALIKLPKSLELVYHKHVQAIEEEYRMAYITTAERIGIEKGIQEGVLLGHQKGREEGRDEGIHLGETMLLKSLLEHKFKQSWASYALQIEEASLEQIQRWGKKILTASTLEEVFET